MSKLKIKILHDIFGSINNSGVNYAVLRPPLNFPNEIGKDLDILVQKGSISKIKNSILSSLDPSATPLNIIETQGDCKIIINLFIRAELERLYFHVYDSLRLSVSKTQRRFGRHRRGFSRVLYLDEMRVVTIRNDEFTYKTLHSQDQVLNLLYQMSTKGNVEKYLSRIGSEALLELEYYGSPMYEYVKRLHTDESGLLLMELNNRVEEYVNNRYGKAGVIEALRMVKSVKGFFMRKEVSYKKLLIYLSGPDGAGKTTSVYEIIKFLENNKIKYKRFRVMHIGVKWRSLIFARIKRFLKGEKVGAKDEFRLQLNRPRDDGTKIYRLKRYIGLLIGLLDTIVLGNIIVGYYRIQGYVVIIETSPADIFIKKHRPKYPTLIKAFAPLLPKPDIGFLMAASPECIFERKPELSIDEIRDYYSDFEYILNRTRFKNYYVEVDSSKGVDFARKKIYESLVEVLFR